MPGELLGWTSCGLSSSNTTLIAAPRADVDLTAHAIATMRRLLSSLRPVEGVKNHSSCRRSPSGEAKGWSAGGQCEGRRRESQHMVRMEGEALGEEEATHGPSSPCTRAAGS